MKKICLLLILGLCALVANAQEIIFSCPAPQDLLITRASEQPNADWNIKGMLNVQLKANAPRQMYYEVATFVPDSVVTLVGRSMEIYANDHLEYTPPYVVCAYKSSVPNLELTTNKMPSIGKNCQLTSDQAAVRCDL